MASPQLPNQVRLRQMPVEYRNLLPRRETTREVRHIAEHMHSNTTGNTGRSEEPQQTFPQGSAANECDLQWLRIMTAAFAVGPALQIYAVFGDNDFARNDSVLQQGTPHKLGTCKNGMSKGVLRFIHRNSVGRETKPVQCRSIPDAKRIGLPQQHIAPLPAVGNVLLQHQRPAAAMKAFEHPLGVNAGQMHSRLCPV